GSTCIVRAGDKVYASGIETVPAWKPLNNCRWMLFRRSERGWEKIMTDEKNRTREPSPLAVLNKGQIYLSANPTLTAIEEYNGPSRPEFYVFYSDDRNLNYKQVIPKWAGNPPFTEHSYRSLAADSPSNELILFQNIGYTHAEWSFLDKESRWSAQVRLVWPWGSDYEVPEPIRICYPNVMLKNKAVYFCGVSDIIEPRKAWREFKRQLTGNEWDYDFRRLFFTWTDDITRNSFHDWMEIASREETCGWIYPADLYAADDGLVHILWTERAIDERLREKFFPGEMQSHALNYALVKNGKVISRQTLHLVEEGAKNGIPAEARFQILPDRRIVVVYAIRENITAGQAEVKNYVREIVPGSKATQPVLIPLRYPFSSFFTATVRGGSVPSYLLDILGTTGEKNTIRYARVILE
ncbi:MAG: hypothetical protein GYA41_10895, partial [Bacteroidales bacterium]|nr:hypothetical protein [Bacteroidales bacterium]